MNNFIITDEHENKIQNWLQNTVYPEAVKCQKTKITEGHPLYHVYQNDWIMGYPYEGVRDGGLSYYFRHTGIGLVFKAKYRCNHRNFELDLTDYDNW